MHCHADVIRVIERGPSSASTSLFSSLNHWHFTVDPPAAASASSSTTPGVFFVASSNSAVAELLLTLAGAHMRGSLHGSGHCG